MAKKSASHGVLFYKRVIAAVLALLILTLAGLVVYYAGALRLARAELSEAQGRLAALRSEAAEESAGDISNPGTAGPSDSTPPDAQDGPTLPEESAPLAESVPNAAPAEREKPAGEAGAAEILDGQALIAQSLGAVGGARDLNCLEGFHEQYEAGIRVFEVDLCVTSDGRVVLRHDWSAGLQEGVDPEHVPTLDGFLAKPVSGRYTPLSFRDLLRLMEEYPDVCVVTDTKLTEPEAVAAQFRAMLDDARGLGLSYLFDRIAVQVYSPEHFAAVDGVHRFPCYIYTLYQDSYSGNYNAFRDRLDFCRENGVTALALDSDLWDPDFAAVAERQGVKIYAYVVNGVGGARWLLRNGVRAIYTDTLTPADLD